MILKNNLVELLEKQLSTLCCALNPKLIGVCSDVIDYVEDIYLFAMPKMHRPLLVPVKNIFSLIEDGLYQMGMRKILKEEER